MLHSDKYKVKKRQQRKRPGKVFTEVISGERPTGEEGESYVCERTEWSRQEEHKQRCTLGMTEGGSKSGWTELRAKTVDEADCYRGSDHIQLCNS